MISQRAAEFGIGALFVRQVSVRFQQADRSAITVEHDPVATMFRTVMLARMVLSRMTLLAFVVVVIVDATSPAVPEAEVPELSKNAEPTETAMPVSPKGPFLEVLSTREMDLGFASDL
ncbi:MAG: hypothetical protein AAF479_06590 [Pseudomonadota bacterium]